MKPIFISHATKDDDAVNRIATTLNAAGIETWVDHQHGIVPGDSWPQEIQDAVNDCSYGLFILSPVSVKSDYCLAEWNRVLGLKKKLYVAQIVSVPLSDYPLRLGIIQYSDLAADFDGGMAELIRAITGGVNLDPNAATTKRGRRITGRIDPRLTTIPMSGRDEDLRQILDHLRTQPVAILGIGGLGKSRLAAEIVRTDEQVQGAIWHVASETSRADEVIELMRDHFDLPVTTDPSDTLKKLRETPTLLVIDNAESVEEGDRRKAYVELITDLVNNAAQVLITGRAEWEELSFVRNDHPQQLPLEQATQIVLDMAHTWTTYDLSAHAEALAKAARQHPRLIEWAVKKTSKFPPEKVIRELNELTSKDIQGALDEMIRKTVQQMVATNGVENEVVLKWFNVFRGGFSYEAAKFLLGLENDEDRLDARLTQLQTWQFVTLRNQRFEIDPLVIAAVREDASASPKHYTYYVTLALQHEQQQDFYGLEVESANLEVAFEWSIRNSPPAALNLFNACGQFLMNRGRFVQQLDWIERIVKALDGASDDLRANAQNSLGTSYGQYPFGDRHDNVRHAVEAYQQALRYWKPQSAPLDYAMTQSNLGIAYLNLSVFEDRESNLHRAIEAYQQALQYSTPQTAPLNYAQTQTNLGNAYVNLSLIKDNEGNLHHAVEAYQQALQYATPQTAPLDYAGMQTNLGGSYLLLARSTNNSTYLNRAITAYHEALRFHTEVSAPFGYAQAQHGLGLALKDSGSMSAAIACWREAEKYYRLMGYVDDADELLRLIAEAEQQQKDSGA